MLKVREYRWPISLRLDLHIRTRAYPRRKETRRNAFASAYQRVAG